jgi:acyl-CoA reductase-like NAD-dependent aldehyde dehydrogenase
MDTVEVRNPRTQALLYTLEEYSDEQVAAVYTRARKAAAILRKMTVRERLNEIGKLKRYLLAEREALVAKICEETGKSRMDGTLAEIFPALEIIDFYERHAERILADEKAPTPLALWPKKSKIYYEPLGVVLVIAPWNYPFVLGFQPTLCALIAGNAVILKPSSYTPLKGLYEEMTTKSGFLPDAIQPVYGSRKTGHKLIEAKPARIHFTGSVEAGRKIMAQAAQHLIPVELELGGKDPMLVFNDAPLERAADGALWGGFVNSGQTCTSVERLYVQEGIYEPFVAMLKAKAEKITTLSTFGNRPDEGDLMMGCMTTDFQIKTVEDQLAQACERGATIVTGGSREPNTHRIAPTIVANVDETMRVHTDETFGPVVTVSKFRTEEEAIAMANDSPFGLSASVWSADLERADRVARALVTGNVSINNVLATQGNSGLPFGGLKDSGFGRYKAAPGLHGFSNIKSIMVDKSSNAGELNWYPYSKKKYKLFSKLLDAMFGGGALSLLRLMYWGTRLKIYAKRHRL